MTTSRNAGAVDIVLSSGSIPLPGAMPMHSDLAHELTNLGINLFIAFLVWSSYRKKMLGWSDRYHTFWPRFWSAFVDSSVLWPIGFSISALLHNNTGGTWTAFLVMLGNVASMIYTVVMHARCGQTVGKMVTKVRVVNVRTEAPISWGQAWLREGLPIALCMGLYVYEWSAISSGHWPPGVNHDINEMPEGPWKFLAMVPVFWFIAEILTMLCNDKRRALHDLIAGTVVIRTNTPANENWIPVRPVVGIPDVNTAPH